MHFYSFDVTLFMRFEQNTIIVYINVSKIIIIIILVELIVLLLMDWYSISSVIRRTVNLEYDRIIILT